MESPKQAGDADEMEWEQREYSSPPCFAHEMESTMSRDAKSDEPITIYHNPSCSKSRETLALIRASGVTPRIVEYLKTPPDAAELAALVRKLGVAPAELIRKGEAVFRQKYGDKALGGQECIEALAADPVLLQRPIVVRGEAAVIGRPPQNVQRLLGGK